MDEIMQTIGASMLGITMNCARCHTHKFDPITLKDYYAMSAVFQDIEFGSRKVEWPVQDARQQKALGLQDSLQKARDPLRDLGAWEEDWTAYRAWHFPAIQARAIQLRFLGPMSPSMNWKSRAFATWGESGFEAPRHQVTGFPSQGGQPAPLTSFRMACLARWHGAPSRRISRTCHGRCHFEERQWVHQINLPTAKPFTIPITWNSLRTSRPTPSLSMPSNSTGPGRSLERKNLLSRGTHPPEKVQDLQTLIHTLKAEGPPMAFVGRLMEPSPTRVLYRGSPESPREMVAPAAPAILNGSLGLTQETSGPDRRLRFAQWMTHPDHPLLARVMVNRIWHHLFGVGLVPITSDFGKAGSAKSPSTTRRLAHHFMHPRESDAWSIKP